MFSQQRISDVTKNYLCRFYQILDNMIVEMTDVELTDSLSHNFIVQMIPHHEGAISMSQNLLRFPICPELLPILRAIITSQREGVQKMRRLLQCNPASN